MSEDQITKAIDHFVKSIKANIRWTWDRKRSSGSSMIKVGTALSGTRFSDIEKEVQGTFGGCWVKYPDSQGRFEYRAYTD